MPRGKFSRFHFALLVLTISVAINFLQARYPASDQAAF